MKTTFDAIILGFGKGGKTLADHLAAQGKTVALVEKSDKMYGGTCINVGCIPSKSLVNSAAASLEQPEESFAQKALRYQRAIEEKRRVTALLREKNFQKLNQNPNVTVLHATARFTGPNTVEAVAEEGVQTLTAENIFINTGATAVLPPIPGLVGNPRVTTSDTLMEQETLPRTLAIVGGGYIGMEFASMYAAFGSEVTVLQDGETFLPREDADVGAEIRTLLEAQKITFRLGVDITELTEDGTIRYRKQGQQQEEKFETILVATGRRPNTEGLNLAAADVAVTDRGAVAVTPQLRASQPGIWAMGDVTGGLQFTYTSLDDFRVVSSQLQGGDFTTEKRKNVPYSVFMATPLSRVGLSETQARQAGYAVKVAVLPTAAIPKAQVLRKTGGLLKAVVDGETNQILGAALLCQESYEMINIIKLAMDWNIPYTVLRDQVFTHPTMSEALNDLFALVGAEG